MTKLAVHALGHIDKRKHQNEEYARQYEIDQYVKLKKMNHKIVLSILLIIFSLNTIIFSQDISNDFKNKKLKERFCYHSI